MQTINWAGYEFQVYGPDTDWYEVAGIYIFASLVNGYWYAKYIGQARNFKTRLPNHEVWAAAVRLGATHVHAMGVPLAANRDRIEKELIQTFQPDLNVQHIGR